MKKNQEVEIRALVSDEELESFISSLSDKGMKWLKEYRVKDTYYCPKKTKSFEEIAMKEVGSYSLRIRERYEGDDQSFDLNSKVLTGFNDLNSWQENETKIKSPQETHAILNNIGFKDFFVADKTRVKYAFDEFNIVVDDIVDFGKAIEVEVLTYKEKAEEVKGKIRSLLLEFGVPEDKILPATVMGILMKEKSYF